MFSKYGISVGYSNLNHKSDADNKISGNGGRRAFGQDITNAKAGGNTNGMTGKPGKPVENNKPIVNKPFRYQQPKIQQSSFGFIGRKDEQYKNDHRNPLVPVANNNNNINNINNTMMTSQRPFNPHSYQFSRKEDDIDKHCVDDPLCVTDYVQDMYDHFRQKEGETIVLPFYMEYTQPHINEKMRAILVDWLVEVHMKFKLVPETLFLTVNLIDRFLEREQVTRSNLQLLGVSCLLIATKYEEIYPPSVSELVYICDNAYTRSDLIKMETHILRALEYQITQPSAHTFLVRFLKAAHADKELSQLACYLLDGTLQSYAMLNFKPSELAAASVFLARHACGFNPWSPTLRAYSHYLEEDIAPVARVLLEEKSAAPPDLHSINKKYSSTRYGNVASKPLIFDF